MEIKQRISEDWLAFIAGFGLILIAQIFSLAVPKFGWNDSTSMSALLVSQNLLSVFWVYMIVLLVGLAFAGATGKPIGTMAAVVTVAFAVSVVAQVLSGYQAFKDIGLEYVIFALLIGILLRLVFGISERLKAALQSEFFIKTGLVLLGTGIIFGDLVKAGSLGLVQALVVVLAVWYFAWWIGKKLGIDDELGIMISSAVSICGVSAAIAACGAIQGDAKKLSYVVSLVLLVALPMMVLMPLVATQMGMVPAVAGAWIGGTIDTTGAVVATGAQLGQEALNVSTIVKLSQNVLLGVAAVAISFFWMMRKKSGEQKADWNLIWERFPKFVVGFIGASIIYSFVLSADAVSASKDFVKGIQTALFAVAFVSIGLETDLSLLVKTGNGRPAAVFLIAQAFNIVFTLLVAYFLFS